MTAVDALRPLIDAIRAACHHRGSDADADLMLRIANRTNGKTFTGDPESIESIYIAISAEQ